MHWVCRGCVKTLLVFSAASDLQEKYISCSDLDQDVFKLDWVSRCYCLQSSCFSFWHSLCWLHFHSLSSVSPVTHRRSAVSPRTTVWVPDRDGTMFESAGMQSVPELSVLSHVCFIPSIPPRLLRTQECSVGPTPRNPWRSSGFDSSREQKIHLWGRLDAWWAVQLVMWKVCLTFGLQ